jgi:hypothetical protein
MQAAPGFPMQRVSFKSNELFAVVGQAVGVAENVHYFTASRK